MSKKGTHGDMVKDFDTVVDEVVANQKNKKMLKSVLWQKLYPLKDGIKRLREQEPPLPYKNIIKIIADVTEKYEDRLQVSEQTLRQFCQEVLQLPKVYRKQKADSDGQDSEQSEKK